MSEAVNKRRLLFVQDRIERKLGSKNDGTCDLASTRKKCKSVISRVVINAAAKKPVSSISSHYLNSHSKVKL